MRKFAKHRWWLVTALLTAPVLAVAADVPFTFAPGTPIQSARVNLNFKDLADRVTALETPAAGGKVIAFAKVSGTTVNYVGGAVATGATSAMSGTGVRVTFQGAFTNPILELVPIVTAEGNPSNFTVANARVAGFGVNSVLIDVWPFQAATQTPMPNAPFFISLMQKPLPQP
jgi:hypothetical protein